MVLEYRVGWAGQITGPGVSVFHGRTALGSTDANAAQDLADATRLFFDAIKAHCPAGLSWVFGAEVLSLNTTTGVLEAAHAVVPPADVAATGSATSWSKPTGARVDWNTGAIAGGRRLRGRTYVVPLIGASYDSTGTISTSALTSLNAGAAAYVAHSGLVDVNPSVWSRVHGIQADITSHDVPDKAAILTSRRD